MIAGSGHAKVGQKAIYLVQESVSGEHGSPTPPINSIRVRGQNLVPDSPGSSLGDVVFTGPAGASLGITPSGAAGDRSFNGTVAVPSLQIIDNNNGGNIVSGQTNTVIVGQQMNLSCQLSVTNSVLMNSMLTNIQWTVPGYAISNYVANSQNATVYTNFPTTNSAAVFYWLDGATNRVLQCSATVDGVTISNQAGFNVMRPLPQFSAQVVGATAVDTNFHVFQISPLDGSIIDEGLDPVGTNWLHFGINTSWTNVGIVFAFSNAPTVDSSSSLTYGEYFVVQLVNNGDIKENLGAGTNLQGSELIQYGLDIAYPFQSSNDDWHIDGYSVRTNDMWFDSPASRLDGTTWLSRTDSFTTFLMFRAGYPNYAYTNSIPIPMYSLIWSWSGKAITNSSQNGYSLSSDSPPPQNPLASQTLGFPTWNTNVAGFLFQTNLQPFNEN